MGWLKLDKCAKIDIVIIKLFRRAVIGFNKDNTWQHVCITWERLNVVNQGMVLFYRNGIFVNKDKDLSKNDPIEKGGQLIIGQKQTTYGGGFDDEEIMVGHMTGLNIWSRVFTAVEVLTLYQRKSQSPDGDVVAWSDVLTKSLEGNVLKICPSTCT